MDGKIILNLAVSLDGYIADNHGGYEWIVGDGNSTLETENKWCHNKFLEDIDVVVMGKKCFDQGMHKDFSDKEVYIATSNKLEDFENYHFINDDIVEEIEKLKNKGKNIYLFGGGILIDSFIKANVIDEYIIGVIPTILGKGIKLFHEANTKIELNLEYYAVEDGIVIMKYSKRNR